ncbi:hypothetical protein BKA70DRAFT_1342239 [Coprinopsis sp. MPI-PUGE-AT-0042]|nr:hypothetical protein BKA70DRAFT_1342239 [Coprinopsis sp. MPI-PUGE-AT-0042]
MSGEYKPMRFADTGQEIEIETRARLSKLRGQRIKTLQQMQGGGMAPIQRVPEDILCEIFMCSVPAEVTFDCMESPMLLTHICRHWRALAWNCSLLWTSLKVKVKQRDSRVTLHHGLLVEWLQRCKGSRIDFQFIFHNMMNGDYGRLANLGDHHLEFFPKALAHVPSFNFRSLTLYHLPLQVVRTFPHNTLPSLERLVLVFHYQDRFRWDGEEPIRAFENCPLLRRVALKGDCLRDLNDALSIPWHQLTHFFFDEEPLSDTLWECVASMSRTCVLQNLTSLTLNFWGVNAQDPFLNLPDLWQYFDFPSLQTLRLIAYEPNLGAWPGHGDTLQSTFFEKIRSLKHLKRLSLCISMLDEEDSSYILGFSPQISHLDLETSSDQYEGIITALELEKGCLPQLKTIVFEVGNGAAFDVLRETELSDDEIISVGTLHSMASSRRTCKDEERLERVGFYGSKSWQVTHFKPFNTILEEFIDGGLVVENRVEEEYRRGKVDDYWIERDECLDDWREAGEIFKWHVTI